MQILTMATVQILLILLGMGLALAGVIRQILRRERRLKEKEQELAEKKIALLVSQIQPHFLYNILGTIQWLCEKDPKKAQEATEQLSHFLRGNMDSLQSVTAIPAARELEHIRCYLNLEGIRFGEKLKTVYDIGTSDFFLPALCLQPLVENAVRHGVTKREEGGTITVRTRQTPDAYVVVIADDGVGFDPETPPQDGRHLGIENVRSRLAAQCGGTVTVESQKGIGTTVTVRIPKDRKKGRRNHAYPGGG